MGCGASRPPGISIVDSQSKSSVRSKGKAPEQSASAAVEEVRSTVVRAWAGGNKGFPEIDDPDYAIPSLACEKAPLAICISGGGFRAATLALGWLRGLNEIGVLKQAKYICTCSGSSWVAAPLCFQRNAAVDEFLGPYLGPNGCTLEALGKVGGKGRSCAAALAEAEPLYDYVKEMLANVFVEEREMKQARAWTKAMTAAFLEPFGLGDADMSTVTCSGTRGQVHTSAQERAAEVGRSTVYQSSTEELPYPIICEAILLPKDNSIYYPFEWTPLYSGCPVLYGNTEPKIGGGYVETLGLNAILHEKLAALEAEEAGGKVPSYTSLRVQPTGPASLGEAIGTSSAYNSYRWALGKSSGGRLMHRAMGFNTATYFNHQDFTSSTLSFTDGGGVDYHAVYPALRRQVPNILLLSASRTAVDNVDKFAKFMKDLAALFGCWPGDPEDTASLTPDEFNNQRQVFPKEGFSQLFAALVAKSRGGQPPVHVAEYIVRPNKFMGIKGGWKVRVMWVINDRQVRWEAALPADTREKLERDRLSVTAKVVEALNPLDADTFREFPHVSTFAMNYTPELVNLMANHAAYMLVENKQLIKWMIASGGWTTVE